MADPQNSDPTVTADTTYAIIAVLPNETLTCARCAQTIRPGFAGTVSHGGGPHLPICDICLSKSDVPLAAVLGAAAILWGYGELLGSVPSALEIDHEELAEVARELALVLTRRFGPWRDTGLLAQALASYGAACPDEREDGIIH